MSKLFTDFDIDDRLLKAVSKLGWSAPTIVQFETIPLALEGKDIIVRAKTGSGKTGAYLIPVIQKILKRKKTLKHEKRVSLVLVPSKELCKQAYRNVLELTSYCSKEVNAIDIGNPSVPSIAPLINTADILVSTPSKILAHLNNQTLVDFKKELEYLVVDEADLMFSYGYEHDLNVLVSHLPKIFQALLLSATISKEVDNFKSLILHNPVILKLDDGQNSAENDQLTQYVVTCADTDKFLLVYALFKLNLIQGKTLIFVNSIDKCYRLKLFFEQFFIKSCVLNSELPQTSRVHIVDEFNRGAYDVVIATDEAIIVESEKEVAPEKKKKKRSKKTDQEFCVSRGIDFQEVDNVLNFDFPATSEAYVHRIGRTARGTNTGTALSFVSTKEEHVYLKKVEKVMSGDEVKGSSKLKPYNFKIDEIEGFRYRVNDAYNSITKLKIKDARLREIKGEIFNSTKLKSYFEDNPKDLKVLRHDKVIAPTERQSHMKNIPDYLVPETLKHVIQQPKRKRKRPIHLYDKGKKKTEDPLRTFKFKKK